MEKVLKSGVFFGVGLFALIFSLLPPKGTYRLLSYYPYTVTIT
jgi:Protein of unknown function (DUF3808)